MTTAHGVAIHKKSPLMFMVDGIMDSLEITGIRDTGMVDGTRDTGVVFVPGDLIIGTIHSGDIAVIGVQILTGDGAMVITILGSTMVLVGVTTATITLGISTTIMATPLLPTEGDQIKIDLSQEAAQIDQIQGHVNSLVLEDAAAVI